MDKKWYGFESYAEDGSLELEAVQLTEEEFAIIKKVFDAREVLYDEGYSGHYALFGPVYGYNSKLDLMRAYAKEHYVDPVDISDEDMAVIIGKEQDEGLFDEEEEE